MSGKGLLRKVTGKCPQCGKRFNQKRTHQKFCSPRCRWISWDAQHPRTNKQEDGGVM
ncbi:hypothetical protein LCGC14_0892150 [marine sediment metagenome]|uniref:DNA gyrase inhibitor YacG n=1 Tax=marine sediment metagenome TaxID=412755 RepID=A0A0F9PJM1_9ZZZZ